MSAYWLDIAWRARLAAPGDKLVLVCLAELAGSEGRCWPVRAKIADMTAMPEEAVKAALERLIADGWITTEAPAPGTAPGLRPAYRLHDLQGGKPS